MIIVKRISKKFVWEGVEWIDLALGTDKWRDVVNAVVSIGVQ